MTEGTTPDQPGAQAKPYNEQYTPQSMNSGLGEAPQSPPVTTELGEMATVGPDEATGVASAEHGRPISAEEAQKGLDELNSLIDQNQGVISWAAMKGLDEGRRFLENFLSEQAPPQD
jgi:hypothetical protein